MLTTADVTIIWGVHCNHYVCPPVILLALSENAHNSWTKWYILIILYILACVTAFFVDEALLSISRACRGQLVKMPITVEAYCIFGSNFELWQATSMQNGDETSPSIISAGRGRLVKTLITLETHGI